MTTATPTKCAAVTRDKTPCMARATTLVIASGHSPLQVCGTHRITFEETSDQYGARAASTRILTGARS